VPYWNGLVDSASQTLCGGAVFANALTVALTAVLEHGLAYVTECSSTAAMFAAYGSTYTGWVLGKQYGNFFGVSPICETTMQRIGGVAGALGAAITSVSATCDDLLGKFGDRRHLVVTHPDHAPLADALFAARGTSNPDWLSRDDYIKEVLMGRGGFDTSWHPANISGSYACLTISDRFMGPISWSTDIDVVVEVLSGIIVSWNYDGVRRFFTTEPDPEHPDIQVEVCFQKAWIEYLEA
jgi:hypothetical protein